MLVIAALVPDTALLVPGAAGRTCVLTDERDAALAVARELVAAAPDRVVVVAPGAIDRLLTEPLPASLEPAGIGAADLAWAPAVAPSGDAPGRNDGIARESGAAADPDQMLSVGAATALLLLATSGWVGATTVLEVADGRADDAGAQDRGGVDLPSARAITLRALGAELVAGFDRVALVVAGSLSARNGLSAPLVADARAGAVDAAMVADLGTGDAAARARLGTWSGPLAAELAVTVWAPLQVLLGATGSAVAAAGHLSARLPLASSPLGVTYAIALWRVEADQLGGGSDEVAL